MFLDLIVCKNTADGNFVKPVGLEHYALGDLRRPPEADGKKWYAVITVGFNQTIKNAPIPLGNINMKVRQLRLIGYEPVLVSLQKEKKL